MLHCDGVWGFRPATLMIYFARVALPVVSILCVVSSLFSLLLLVFLPTEVRRFRLRLNVRF